MNESPTSFDADRRSAITQQVVEEAAASARSSVHRAGIALCLSGGGFRAALLHLGAVRRLDELGLLARIDTVSSVSGGSIFAGFLASLLLRRFGPAGIPVGHNGPLFLDFTKDVAHPFRTFVSRDARTEPLLRRVWVRNWFRPQASVLALAEHYERHLTPLRLAELPERPHFILCATDMIFSVNWEFDRERMGDWQAGYVPTPSDWPLARAVAASSCFPPLFPPLPVNLRPDSYKRGSYRGRDRLQLLRRMSLTDGGVYDNLGLEPVWKRHAVVLVSDGGGRFGFTWASTPLSRVFAYSNILQIQIGALRVRWLQSSFSAHVLQGAYWGLTSPGSAGRPAGAGYSQELARERIGVIRTDLDAFSEAESSVLENQGYLQADAALTRAVTEGKLDASLLPNPLPALQVPSPLWMDETRVMDALRNGHERISVERWWQRLLGRPEMYAPTWEGSQTLAPVRNLPCPLHRPRSPTSPCGTISARLSGWSSATSRTSRQGRQLVQLWSICPPGRARAASSPCSPALCQRSRAFSSSPHA
jgi:NTE family protein